MFVICCKLTTGPSLYALLGASVDVTVARTAPVILGPACDISGFRVVILLPSSEVPAKPKGEQVHMAPRSRSTQRCLACRMFVPLCICSIAPRFHLQTRVVILMHHRELTQTTSTALLAKITLSNFELRVRGIRDEPMSNEDLTPEGRQSLVLYPSEEAQELNHEYVTTLTKPISLIVLDGNWRQAAKMGSRIAELRDVPRVKLPVGAPSEFRLRHEHRNDGMSTFEAIARALGIIEGAKVQQELEAIFKIRVERTLWSRGKLAPEHCSGGVPEAAYLAHYLAGCAGGPKPRSPRTEI